MSPLRAASSVERKGLFIAAVLDEQIQPGTFEFALAHLVDEALDLNASPAYGATCA